MTLAAAGNKTLALEPKKTKLACLRKPIYGLFVFCVHEDFSHTLQLEVGDHVNQQKAV